MANNNGNGKSLESWIWDAACSIRGAKDAPKYKDYILPLIFTKRLCDAETYWPIAEIVVELNAIELAARETDEALRGILKQLGFGA